jgi:YHYH protein/Secretion system C-terminal sorting domain
MKTRSQRQSFGIFLLSTCTMLSSIFTIALQISFAQTTPELAAWKLNRTGATGYGGIVSDVSRIRYSANSVYINANSVPGYAIGPWMANPNVPSAQNLTLKIPRKPQAQTGTKTTVGLGSIGIWTNGVTIYNADDGMSYNNAGTWKRNAYVYEGISFDACSGHADRSGSYHHHINPKCLYTVDATKHSPIVGFAYDGFPIYGPFANASTNGTGAIKRMTSSYRVRSITQRTTLPGSTAMLSAAQQGPAVSAQYPLGNFLQDFEYVAGLGDLDQYNGRFAITPDYPQGIYAYYVTVEADLATPAYPFAIGLQYYGVVETANTGPMVGKATVSESVQEFTGVSSGIREGNVADVRVFPNPAHSTFTVEMNNPQSGMITLSLVHASGETIFTVRETAPQGAFRKELNVSNLAAGTYFLEMKRGTGQATERFVEQFVKY